MQKFVGVYGVTWSQGDLIFQMKVAMSLCCCKNSIVEGRGILLCWVLSQCEPTLNLKGNQTVLESES